jgi:hypothetical protein
MIGNISGHVRSFYNKDEVRSIEYGLHIVYLARGVEKYSALLLKAYTYWKSCILYTSHFDICKAQRHSFCSSYLIFSFFIDRTYIRRIFCSLLGQKGKDIRLGFVLMYCVKLIPEDVRTYAILCLASFPLPKFVSLQKHKRTAKNSKRKYKSGCSKSYQNKKQKLWFVS